MEKKQSRKAKRIQKKIEKEEEFARETKELLNNIPKHDKQEETEFKILLNEENLEMIDTIADGNCLFRALAVLTTSDHSDLRRRCCEEIVSNKDFYSMFIEIDFEVYLEDLRSCRWGDQLEIQALSKLLGKCIWVYQSDKSVIKQGDFDGEPLKIR